jgi:peroxiredoxin
MAIKVGDKAPIFTLYSSEKEEVKLEDFQGKSNVLILFFPLAFTGVCTTEMCTMRDNMAMYNEMNAEVLGISIDTVFTLEKFKAAENLNFTLLSDFNKDVSKTYSAFYEDFVLGMKGVSKRGDLPDFEAIKSTLSSLN